MWTSMSIQAPPDNTKVLGYTDEHNYKVVTYYKGMFDTYMQILFWMPLPEPPEKDTTYGAPKKRGRKKKV